MGDLEEEEEEDEVVIEEESKFLSRQKQQCLTAQLHCQPLLMRMLEVKRQVRLRPRLLQVASLRFLTHQEAKRALLIVHQQHRGMEEEEEEEEAWIKALEQVLFHRFLMKKEAKVIVAALVEEDLQDLKKPYHNRVLLMNRQPAKEPTEVLLRLLLVHERNYMLREV
jgi:hypothetical protein